MRVGFAGGEVDVVGGLAAGEGDVELLAGEGVGADDVAFVAGGGALGAADGTGVAEGGVGGDVAGRQPDRRWRCRRRRGG